MGTYLELIKKCDWVFYYNSVNLILRTKPFKKIIYFKNMSHV